MEFAASRLRFRATLRLRLVSYPHSSRWIADCDRSTPEVPAGTGLLLVRRIQSGAFGDGDQHLEEFLIALRMPLSGETPLKSDHAYTKAVGFLEMATGLRSRGKRLAGMALPVFFNFTGCAYGVRRPWRKNELAPWRKSCIGPGEKQSKNYLYRDAGEHHEFLPMFSTDRHDGQP